MKRETSSSTDKSTRQREILLSQLAGGSFRTLRARVAFVLNNYPDTRNSDKQLVWRYWRLFYPDVIGDEGTMTEEKLWRVENYVSLTRARAKIQNEFGLFQASEEVREMRRERELTVKEEAVEDQPGIPLVDVYCDESGKTGRFTIVASLWTYDAHKEWQFRHRIDKLKSDRRYSGEFHFSDLTLAKLQAYKEFFGAGIELGDAISFKAIIVRNSGLQDSLDTIVTKLHYHLIRMGLGHEFETGRITRPRVLKVWKDKEDGMDALRKAALLEELGNGLRASFGDGVRLDLVEAVDSKGNYLIQLADIFAGALNRALNPQDARNQKDEMADYVLGILGLTIGSDGSVGVNDGDFATVISLQ